MFKGKPLGIKILLLIMGLVIIVNIIGLIIEILFGTGLIKLNSPISVREFNVIFFVLSVAFIFSSIVFFKCLLRVDKKAIVWWHLTIVFALLLNVYKVFNPTYLVSLIPYYFIFSFALVLLIWAVVFVFLKKRLNFVV